MTELELKALIVLVMMIVVGYLTIKARRRNFDAFRAEHTKRKYRVPVDAADAARPEDPKP